MFPAAEVFRKRLAVKAKRILIADDHPQAVAACRAALEADGHEVLAAKTLAEAARLAGEPTPDVVALDAMLPGGDVVEFCSALSGARRVRRVPILLLVPPKCPERLLSALRPLGCERIFKPFSVSAFRERVQTLLAAQYASSRNRARRKEPPADALQEAAASWKPATLAGMEIGGCRLERILGRGASGTVYLGRHLLLDVPVAVKVFDAAAAAGGRENLRRFGREARAAARIEHPNVVAVLNAGTEEGRCFLVQRFIEGATLKSRIEAECRLDEPSVARILRDVASGLSAAHALGVIHRDVKPGNIILAASGLAMLTDFGLARMIGGGEISTESGLVGTPYYMAPEECLGRAVDGRTDLYSLGATGYHAATGRPPFAGATAVEVIRGHVQETAPSPKELAPELSRGFSEILMKLLAKSPDERYGTAEELLRALARLGPG